MDLSNELRSHRCNRSNGLVIVGARYDFSPLRQRTTALFPSWSPRLTETILPIGRGSLNPVILVASSHCPELTWRLCWLSVESRNHCYRHTGRLIIRCLICPCCSGIRIKSAIPTSIQTAMPFTPGPEIVLSDMRPGSKQPIEPQEPQSQGQAVDPDLRCGICNKSYARRMPSLF